jgi:hypothetical protein
MTITEARKKALAKRFGDGCKLTDYSWITAMDDDMAGSLTLYVEDMIFMRQGIGQTVDECNTTTGRETGIFITCNVEADVYVDNVKIGVTNSIIELSTTPMVLLISKSGYVSKQWAIQLTEGNIWNVSIDLDKVTETRKTGIFVSCNVTADILLNNVSIGRTGNLIILTAGTKLLLITANGYEPKSWAAQVTEGSITNVQITLDQATADRKTGIYVDCNVIADVYCENIKIGNTGEIIATEPGTKALMITKSGHTTKTWATQVTTGSITNVQITLLEAPAGRDTGIYIDCNVKALVILDNGTIGETGQVISLEPGTKRLIIAKNGYVTRTWAAQVINGSITNVQMTLEETTTERSTGMFIDCNVTADIYTNNAKIGTTGELIIATPGTKTIMLTRDGYKTKSWTLQITEGNITNTQITLEETTIGRNTGIYIDCNVLADVYANEEKIGTANTIIVTEPGTMTITLQYYGYEPRSWTLQVTNGSITNTQITLEKSTTATTGMLVSCNVVAEVHMDGEKLGDTGKLITMTSGAHTITISKEGYTPKNWAVQITEGSITNVSVTLVKETTTTEIEGENGVDYTILILKDGTGAPITSKPATITVGVAQWYSIMIKNEQETNWYGYTGVKLTDENGNTYTHEPNKQYATTVAPEETKSIKTQVTIPSDVVLTGTITVSMMLRGFRTKTT